MDIIPEHFSIKLNAIKMPFDVFDSIKLNDEDTGKVFKSVLEYFFKGSTQIDDRLRFEYELMVVRILAINKFFDSNYCYVIRMYNQEEEFIKIGFSKNPSNRYLSFNNEGYVVQEIVKMSFESRQLGMSVESRLHKMFEEHRYYPVNKFGGCTECFNVSIVEEVKKELEAIT